MTRVNLSPQASMAFAMGRPEFPHGNIRIFRQNKPGFEVMPYLTSVNLEKTLDGPAGMFDLTLAYSPDASIDKNFPTRTETGETIEDFLLTVEPFDYIEIQIRSDPGGPTYWMRGFIDNVAMEEDAGSGNEFRRSVTISGRDYGGLLQDWSIHFYQANGRYKYYKSGTIMATGLWEALFNRSEQEIYGAQKGEADPHNPKKKLKQNMPGLFNSMKNPVNIHDFVAQIVHYGINEGHLKQVRNWCAAIHELFIDINIPRYFGVNPSAQTFITFEGSLFDLLLKIQGEPVGEMFIRDDDDGPRFVFRITPWLREDGHIAWDKPGTDFRDIRFTEIDRTQVKSSSLRRDTSQIYTSFLTLPCDSQGTIYTQDVLASGLQKWFGFGNPYNFADAHPDNTKNSEHFRMAQKYGMRQKVNQTSWLMGDPNIKFFQLTAPSGIENTKGTLYLASLLNNWLVDTMSYGWKLYEGSITCRGVYPVRVGDYIYYQRSTRQEGLYFYVQGIGVSWSEGGAVITTFNVVRGQANNKIANHIIHGAFAPDPKEKYTAVGTGKRRASPRRSSTDPVTREQPMVLSHNSPQGPVFESPRPGTTQDNIGGQPLPTVTPGPTQSTPPAKTTPVYHGPPPEPPPPGTFK